MKLELLTEEDLKIMLGSQAIFIEQLSRYIQKLEAVLADSIAKEAERSRDGAKEPEEVPSQAT